jgi:hypothetical protein
MPEGLDLMTFPEAKVVFVVISRSTDIGAGAVAQLHADAPIQGMFAPQV